MDIDTDRYLYRQNGGIYLIKKNGLRKGFATVLDEVLDNYEIKIKQRIRGKVLGLRNAGKYGNEIWLKNSSRMIMGKTLVHEIVGTHLDDEYIIDSEEPEELIEYMTKIIWSNKRCREITLCSLREILNEKISIT